jgi:excisionase family DNA binding protein
MRVSDEVFLNVKEVAERLRVHPETVREWIRTGALRGLRLGKRSGFRVSESDLAVFIEHRKLAA